MISKVYMHVLSVLWVILPTGDIFTENQQSNTWDTATLEISLGIT